jgi:hypothetical protein
VANVGDDNRLAPPGGILLNLDPRPRPRPAEPTAAAAGTVPSVSAPRKRRPAEPSWGRVLATTLRLWLPRQVTVRRRRTTGVVAAAAVVTVAALALSGAFSGTAAPARAARAASAPSAARATAHPSAARPSAAQPAPAQPSPVPAAAAAAAWLASQLSSGAIIGCDPALCTALQAQGVTAARLMPLNPGAPDPHGVTVVVTSDPAAIQYAPAVIASFGSGAAQIDVRATEPGGAAAYETALRADQAARMSAGSQLLRNKRIRFTAADAAQLRAGRVDARLLATLAALASQYPFSVTAFGDAAPGVAALYREATITAAGPDLTAALALLKAQVPPFLPAQAEIVNATLNVEYAAPSPLGLLTAVLGR